MTCWCDNRSKTHFASNEQFGYRGSACGRKYALGHWTSEECMLGKDPFRGPDCQNCLKWLKRHKPDLLVEWRKAQVNQLRTKDCVSVDPPGQDLVVLRDYTGRTNLRALTIATATKVVWGGKTYLPAPLSYMSWKNSDIKAPIFEYWRERG
jgi:hypothetical protein